MILDIDSEGNLIFNCSLANDEKLLNHYNFSGKLADTFGYPYTIELTFTASSLSSTSCYLAEHGNFSVETTDKQPKKTGKFTFHDASTLTASVIMLFMIEYNGGYIYWYDGGVQTLNFTKQ